jgi:pyrimidine-specific ribonucleoside hydrolase
VIIDDDMGQSGVMTILYLLERPDLAVKAITVSGTGLVHCAAGIAQARGLLLLAGQPDIPVACGRETPLPGGHAFPAAWREDAETMRGLPLPPADASPPSEDAAALLAATVAAQPGRVTLLALGPLTNVAEAFARTPTLAGQLAEIIVMGGAVGVPGHLAAAGIANTSAEWNIYADPLAAQQVLAADVPVTLVPLDATNAVPLDRAFYDQLALDHAAPAAHEVYDLLTLNRHLIADGGYYLWDQLAAVLLTDPDIATYADRRIEVVAAEGPESGRTRLVDSGVAVRVAVAADRARFEQVFLATLRRS